MMKKMIFTFLLFGPVYHGASQELSKKEIKEACREIAALIQSNYVLEARGSQIAAAFLEHAGDGRFNRVQNWNQLDSAINSSLTEISGDGHLYVRHDPQFVQELKSEWKEDQTGGDAQTFFNNEKAYHSNFGFKQVEILDGNIGYIQLSNINISNESLETLFATMAFVRNTNALIIDLRDNGGGGSNVGAVLETFFLEKNTALLAFTDRNGRAETVSTVSWLTEKPYTKPVFVLINKGTASAAEAFAFVLKHQHRATIIGEPSAGAAFMNNYFVINDNLVLSVSMKAPFLPGTQTTWQGAGVKPDITVAANRAKEKAIALALSE